MAIALAAAGLSASGGVAADRTAARTEALADRNGAVFDRVWSLVDRHYWDDARLGERWETARDRYRSAAVAAATPRALYAVIGTMLGEIGDSHVFATDPARHAFETAREGDGGERPGMFGFSTWQRDGAWRIFAVTPGSPAATAGVRAGWRLTAVDGRPVDDDWHPAIGARSTLDFLDPGNGAHRLVLTAAPLDLSLPWHAVRTADGVLIATLDAFERDADRWLRGEIATGRRPGAVILDLRENGGGEAMAVGRVAGIFFAEKRTLIEQVGRSKPLRVPILGTGREDGWDGPLAVLVGPRSASGAEALAALIRESGRGMTIGERTAGALTGAALFDLPDGGQLSVAEFDIRTGGGRRLEGVGFVPDHVVRASDVALARGEDPVLAAALRLIGGGRAEPAAR